MTIDGRPTLGGMAALAGLAATPLRAQEATRWPAADPHDHRLRARRLHRHRRAGDGAGVVRRTGPARGGREPCRRGRADRHRGERAGAPDGYTVLLGTISTHAINVGLYRTLPYDPIRSFTPVSGVSSGYLVLVVHPSVRANSVAEIVALARAEPGKLSYGSGGNGTTSHLAGELFKSLAGVDMLHVPFRSPAPAASALPGQVDVMIDTVPSALPQIRGGRLRALGVSAPPRPRQVPGVPPIADRRDGGGLRCQHLGRLLRQPERRRRSRRGWMRRHARCSAWPRSAAG